MNQTFEEWETEVDEVEGENVYILRHKDLLSLCGYEGVPKNHPWFGKGYSEAVIVEPEVRDKEIDKISPIALLLAAGANLDESEMPIDCIIQVHGGITYSADHRPGKEPDELWWFGFDCSHSGDLAPGLDSLLNGTYRNLEFVKQECRSLMKQLMAVKQQGINYDKR